MFCLITLMSSFQTLENVWQQCPIQLCVQMHRSPASGFTLTSERFSCPDKVLQWFVPLVLSLVLSIPCHSMPSLRSFDRSLMSEMWSQETSNTLSSRDEQKFWTSRIRSHSSILRSFPFLRSCVRCLRVRNTEHFKTVTCSEHKVLSSVVIIGVRQF